MKLVTELMQRGRQTDSGAAGLADRHGGGGGAPDRSLSELDLKARVHRLIGAFESTGAHVYVPFGEESHAVSDGLQLLLKRQDPA